jgi:hypothetical protein
MDLDRFKPDHWWNVVAFAGGLIAVAAVPSQFVAAFLIGLGLLFFGAGEWVNHPRQTQVKGAKVVGLYRVTSNPWKPKVHGILMDGLGISLFALGFSDCWRRLRCKHSFSGKHFGERGLSVPFEALLHRDGNALETRPERGKD